MKNPMLSNNGRTSDELSQHSLHGVLFYSIMISYTQTLLMDINTQIRIQDDKNYWYTVEDMNIDVGFDGFTLSYWEFDNSLYGKRLKHITMNKDEALAVADAICKLFKEDN